MKIVKQGLETIVGVTVGGATIGALRSSVMPSNLRDVAKIGVGVGVLGNTLRNASISLKSHSGKNHKKWRL